MATLFTVEIEMAFGTGGIALRGKTHRYWSGRAVATNASPKQATATARRLALAKCGEGASWTPVWERTVVSRGNVIVSDSLDVEGREMHFCNRITHAG